MSRKLSEDARLMSIAVGTVSSITYVTPAPMAVQGRNRDAWGRSIRASSKSCGWLHQLGRFPHAPQSGHAVQVIIRHNLRHANIENLINWPGSTYSAAAIALEGISWSYAS
jgi:hypothetical protein